MDKKFQVGQILYVVLNKQTKVIPCQVVEELTKKTLSGNSVVYRVSIGKSGDVRDLNDIDGEIFVDPDVVRTELGSRATKMIAKMVAAAQKAAQEWYNQPPTGNVDVANIFDNVVVPDDPEATLPTEEDSDTPVVQLPDGRVAKVKSIKVDPKFKTGS